MLARAPLGWFAHFLTPVHENHNSACTVPIDCGIKIALRYRLGENRATERSHRFVQHLFDLFFRLRLIQLPLMLPDLGSQSLSLSESAQFIAVSHRKSTPQRALLSS